MHHLSAIDGEDFHLLQTFGVEAQCLWSRIGPNGDLASIVFANASGFGIIQGVRYGYCRYSIVVLGFLNGQNFVVHTGEWIVEILDAGNNVARYRQVVGKIQSAFNFPIPKVVVVIVNNLAEAVVVGVVGVFRASILYPINVKIEFDGFNEVALGL